MRAVPQGYEDVFLPCEKDFHLRILFPDFLSQFLGNGKREVLFLRAFVLAYASRILASVARINDYGVEPEVSCALGVCRT